MKPPIKANICALYIKKIVYCNNDKIFFNYYTIISKKYNKLVKNTLQIPQLGVL